MEKPQIDNKDLQRDMEHVLKDAERFLSDLKGQKRVRGRARKRLQSLKEHMTRLTKHLKYLEGRNARCM